MCKYNEGIEETYPLYYTKDQSNVQHKRTVSILTAYTKNYFAGIADMSDDEIIHQM